MIKYTSVYIECGKSCTKKHMIIKKPKSHKSMSFEKTQGKGLSVTEAKMVSDMMIY